MAVAVAVAAAAAVVVAAMAAMAAAVVMVVICTCPFLVVPQPLASVRRSTLMDMPGPWTDWKLLEFVS